MSAARQPSPCDPCNDGPAGLLHGPSRRITRLARRGTGEYNARMMTVKECRERLFELTDQLRETTDCVGFHALSPISAEDAQARQTQLVKAIGSGLACLIDECRAFLNKAEPMIARYKRGG